MTINRMDSSNYTSVRKTGALSWLPLCAVLAAGLLGSAAGRADNPAAGDAEQAAAKVPDTEWRLLGEDYGEKRFSELEQITRDNVDDLGLAWYFDMYTQRGVEATPLMVDGVLYVSGAWSMVYALDARTGDLKWFYNPDVDRSFLARGCCDAVNRGVAYADGKIIASTYDGRLVALNADDGKVLWDVQTTDREKKYTITGAPRIVNDKVVIGNGGAELGGIRGYVSAYYLKDGKQAWRFYTIPGNPADGFENDAMKMAAKTWTGEWWKWGGGGTAWDAMVFDPELNLLYIGVGNGAPWNQKLRSPEGGDNLFLSSIVAVNGDTGEYVWHYQTTPGETWDYTSTQPIMLADMSIDGKPRKVLMQAPKNGFFYVLDRVTGELLSAKPYISPILWASHVDMETGRPVETENARLFDGENVSSPTNAGGHNWHPMSWNPETGLVYFPVLKLGITFLDPTEEKDAKPDQGYWNVGFDRMANVIPGDQTPEEMAAIFAEHAKGSLIAYDPLTGETVWEQPDTAPIYGGTLSTAGGLVFFGANLDEFLAADAKTGEILWQQETGATVMAAPMTYALDGEQYIAVAAGFGGGAAAEAGAVFHALDAPRTNRVLVYKLGADKALPEPVKTEREMPEPEAVTASAEVVAHGQKMYQRHCSYCHGDELRTGGVYPDLRWSSESVHDMWEDIVIKGALKPLGMVNFDQYLSEKDAEAIRQYVLSEARKLYDYREKQASAAATGE